MAAVTSRGKLVERYYKIQTAIDEIEGGAQSATINEGGGSRSYTRANLSQLYSERTRVNQAIRTIDGTNKKIQRVQVGTR